jgi:hypothetical protein
MAEVCCYVEGDAMAADAMRDAHTHSPYLALANPYASLAWHTPSRLQHATAAAEITFH